MRVAAFRFRFYSCFARPLLKYALFLLFFFILPFSPAVTPRGSYAILLVKKSFLQCYRVKFTLISLLIDRVSPTWRYARTPLVSSPSPYASLSRFHPLSVLPRKILRSTIAKNLLSKERKTSATTTAAKIATNDEDGDKDPRSRARFEWKVKNLLPTSLRHCSVDLELRLERKLYFLFFRR